MENKIIIYAIAVAFLLSGCASDEPFKGGRAKARIYKLDLDSDGIEEVVRVDDDVDQGTAALITIMRRDKSEAANIKVPGKLVKTEYPEMKGDGFKQIAVYYDDSENRSNLVIYNFKDGKVSTLASFSSKCGIEASLVPNLARIKIGKPKPGETECPCESMSEYDLLVWTGEKFIKER